MGSLRLLPAGEDHVEIRGRGLACGATLGFHLLPEL
ncbi:hypothetical protein V6Z11_D10G101500 [Gossypium hirsutum]